MPDLSLATLLSLALLILLRSFVELAGLASAYPMLLFLSDENAAQNNKYVIFVMQGLGLEWSKEILYLLVAAYCFFLAVNYLVIAVITIVQYQFVYQMQLSASITLLKKYLEQPMSFFFVENSKNLAKNVNINSNEFAAGYILHLLFLITAAITLIFLLFALFAFDPIITITSFVYIFICYIFFASMLSGKLKQWGHQRDTHMGLMYQHAEEAISGVREIKVTDSSQWFISRFKEKAINYKSLNLKFQSASLLPNFMIQAFLMATIALGLIVLWLSSHPIESVLPSLGIFYIGFSRILPLGNQVYANWSTVKYFQRSFDVVINGILQNPSQASDVRRESDDVAFDNVWMDYLDTAPLIEFKNVSFTYSDESHFVISDLSFKVSRGTSVALVGKSGSGKSTILDLALGLIAPSSGSIFVNGKQLSPHALKSWRDSIGYVPQELYLLDGSLAENITLTSGERISHEKLERSLERAKLRDLVDKFPLGPSQRLGDRAQLISGGERQRIGIARALYRDAQVIILDESTSALDERTEIQIVDDVLKLSREKTVIFVTHNLDIVKKFDVIIDLEKLSK